MENVMSFEYLKINLCCKLHFFNGLCKIVINKFVV